MVRIFTSDLEHPQAINKSSETTRSSVSPNTFQAKDELTYSGVNPSTTADAISLLPLKEFGYGFSQREEFQDKTFTTMQKGLSTWLTRLALILISFFGISLTSNGQDIDLALTKSIDNSTPNLGDQITYTVYLVNQDTVTATNIQVLDKTPFGSINNIIINSDGGTPSYNSLNGEVTWNVPSLLGGDSLKLEITADVVARGVFFNIAEIMAHDQTDYDSQPANGDLSEDDIASSCFSVPIYWYTGDEYTVTIPTAFNPGTGVTWYKDGVVVDSTTMGARVSGDTLVIASSGSYTFTTLVNTCPASGCCAIIMLEGPYGEIGDFVWLDTNKDGIQDSGEPGIENTMVYLWDDGGGLLDSTLTDSLGHYLFDSLENGNYQVQFSITPDRIFSPTNATTDDLDSDADALGFSPTITIDVLDASGNPRLAGDVNRYNNNVDAGLSPAFDLMLTKTMVSSGPFTPGQTITFNLEVNNQGITDATQINLIDYIPAGLILFDNDWLMTGSNAVLRNTLNVSAGNKILVPITFQIDGSFTGSSITNSAEIFDAKGPSGENMIDEDSTPNNNIGSEDDQDSETITVNSSATIGNFVWNDLDEDGIQDPAEPGMSGVTVRLELPNGTLIDSTTTDGGGFYSFTNLTPGDYVVVFTEPADYSFSPANQTVDANDSDADPTTGESPIITLLAGETNLTVDAALYFSTICENVTMAMSTNTSICVNESSNLIATSSDSSDINWYYSSIGGVPLFTSASGTPYTVSPTTTTTYYAQVSTSQPGCTIPREPVTVVVNVIPPDPTVDGPIEICDTETADLTAFMVSNPYTTNGTLEWHTGVTSTSPVVTDPTAVSGGNYYLFERTVSGCYSNPALLKVTEKPCDQFIDLSLVKIADTRLIAVNDTVTFTVELNNAGPGVATNVVLRDQLPAGLEFVSSNGFTNASGVLTANIDSVLSGQTITLTYLTRVTSTSGSIVNIVEVLSADQMDVDSTPGNAATTNEDDDDDEVITLINPLPTADLSLIKLVSNETPTKGDVINYTIAVTNNGTIDATNVEVQDIMPAGLTYISATGGTINSFNNNTVTALWGNVTNGQTVKLNIQVRVDSVGDFINAAEITKSDQPDPDSTPGNSSSNEDDDDTVTISVSDNCNPVTPAIVATNFTICLGDSTQLLAVGCNGTVTWTNGMTGASIYVSPTSNTSYMAYCTVSVCNSPMSNSVTVTVSTPTAPVIAASSTEICSGDQARLTATGCAGLVNWSNGQSGTSIDVTPTANTTYTATCTIGSCVSGNSNSVDIQVGPAPEIPVLVASANNTCSGDLITITASGCTQSLVWNTGATTASIDVSPTSNTTYSATCGTGVCAGTETIDITVNSSSPVVITPSTNDICAGQTVTLTAGGCTSGLLWSTGATSSVISVQPNTTQSYSVLCGTGSCQTSDSITINVGTGAPLTIIASNDSVCQGDVVTLTVTGCADSLVWNTGQVGASIQVTPMTTTAYSVVCGSGACASTGSTTIVTNPGGSPVTITASSNDICDGQTVTLTATGCSSALTWSTGASTDSISVQPNATQSYSVVCGTGACQTSDSVTINVNSSTPLTLIASSDSVCQGDVVTITVTGCTDSLVWNTGQVGASIQVTPMTTTAYSVVCGSGACASTGSTTIVTNPGGSPVTITASSNDICDGQTVTLTATGCSSALTWSTGASTDSISVQPNATQSYSVVCGTGSCQTSDSITINVNTGVPVNIVASSDTVCQGSDVTLTANGCSDSLVWSTGQTGASILVSPVATTVYSVVCGSGACASSGSATIVVNSVGNPVTITPSTNDICASETVTLSASGCTASLLWSTGATTAAISVSPNSTQNYSVICGSGACQTADTVSITVKPAIAKPTVNDLANACPVNFVDLNDALTSSPASAGGVFVFKSDNSTSSQDVANPDSITVSGNYFVFEQSTGGCFSAGESITVTITSCLDCVTDPATAFAGNDTTICLKDDFIVLNGSIGGAASNATWSTSGTGTFENAGSLTSRYNFSHQDIIDGEVTLTLVTNDPDDSGSCVADSSSMIITINADIRKPTISTDKTPIICLGDSITLTIDQDAPGYLWSTGDTTKSIVVSTAGTFTAKLINVDGCASISSDSVEVNTNASITAPVVDHVANNVCPATTVNLMDHLNSSPVTAGGSFEFRMGIEPTSARLTDSSKVTAGTYYVFEKTSQGCYSNPSQIQVAINDCDTTAGLDVGILIVGSKGQTVVDGLVTFTITVKNNGPTTATNVKFENDVPTSLQIQGTPTGLNRSGNMLSGSIDSLAVGESKVFNYTVKVLEDGEVTTVARITDLDQTDTFLPNNTSSFKLLCSTCQEICLGTSLKADTTRLENGSFDIKFTALLQNCGNVDLTNMSLTADLAKMFGAEPTFSMVQQPIANAGSGLVPNVSFNGNSDINVLDSISVLEGADIDTVTWVINLLPNGTEGPYSINTRVVATGLTIFGTEEEARDLSNDGLYVDQPSATPTVVRLYKSPSIGLALAIIDTVYQDDNSINVTYQAIVKNNGPIDLFDVVVSDSLFKTYFAPASYTMVNAPVANSGSTVIANANYDGINDVNMTSDSSTLAIGQADTLIFTINVKPEDITTFSNQAIAKGTGTLDSGSNETVTDVSNDGFNPDVPGNNPTILDLGDTQSTQDECIGVALYVADSSKLEDGSFDITYHALIQNCGNVNLTNISMCDSLNTSFPAPSVAILKAGPSLDTGSALAIDSTYDGITNICMLDPSLSSIAPNRVDTIKWTINLTLNGFNGPFRKNVTARAITPADEEIVDISNDGMDPNPIGEAPTVLNFNNLPPDMIGLAKELVSIESVGGTVYDVTFDFVIKNYGVINFTGVQLQDNIAETFGDKVSIDSVRVFNTSAGILANDQFTGKGNLINMLVDTASVLPRNGTERVSLMVRVDLAQADTLVYENMALAIGYQNGTSTDDQSNDGDNPDPDADGTPYNNTLPTVIDFRGIIPTNVTPLGIAKQMTDTTAVADGSYEVTYTFVVKNYGDTLLTNIQIRDSLSSVFADSTDWDVIDGPTASGVGTLTINDNFDGLVDLNMLVADSSYLAVGASDTITMKLKVRNNGSAARTYMNTAYGEATFRGEIVTDESNTGLNPDPEGDNNPGDNNESTPLVLPGLDNTPSGAEIVIPGGISPNGDGINDALVIEGINASDSLQLYIYNRWGALVFKTDNYKRDFPGAADGWKGVANTGIRFEKGDSKLPDGTYFFKAESSNPKLLNGEAYYNFITIAGGGGN